MVFLLHMLSDMSLLKDTRVILILYKLGVLYKGLVTVRICEELLSDTVPDSVNVLLASQHLAGVLFPLSRGTNTAACV